MLLKFFHIYRTWWLQGLVMKYKAFCFQVSGSNMVQVDSAKDYSHWVSVFDGLCKMHWFSSPGRQVCISHKATVTADTNWCPCWHFRSSQKLNECSNWARCCQCSTQSRPWLWGSDKACEYRGWPWAKRGCRSVPLFYGLLVLKVMVTYPDSHMLLRVMVNSWVMSTALGERETQSTGRSKNGLEMFELGRETRTIWKTELALFACFCRSWDLLGI